MHSKFIAGFLEHISAYRAHRVKKEASDLEPLLQTGKGCQMGYGI